MYDGRTLNCTWRGFDPEYYPWTGPVVRACRGCRSHRPQTIVIAKTFAPRSELFNSWRNESVRDFLDGYSWHANCIASHLAPHLAIHKLHVVEFFDLPRLMDIYPFSDGSEGIEYAKAVFF